MGGTKLLTVKKSTKPGKKWNFTFKRATSGRTFTTSAGDSSAENYTMHHNKTRRSRYLERHKKNLGTGDPTRAGYISYYVLWGPSKSFEENLRAYKKRFGL
jgi:hypothetical protein